MSYLDDIVQYRTYVFDLVGVIVNRRVAVWLSIYFIYVGIRGTYRMCTAFIRLSIWLASMVTIYHPIFLQEYIVQNWVIFYCGIPSRVILSGSSGVTERHSIVKLCYADPVGIARGNQSSPHNPIIG